jgi:O-Antigen ligase
MRPIYQPIIDYFRKVNWMLLLFLVLVLDVKMVVKVPALLVLLFLNRSLLKDKSIYKEKFTWLYFSLIFLAAINLIFLVSSAPKNYLFTVVVGIAFWLLCAAAAFLSCWFIRKASIEKLHATVTFFFVLNAIVTLSQLLWVMIDAGSLNPYTYQGMHQKYFIGTGDQMTGITFDVSTTNALINSFAVLYFLRRNKMHLVLLSMVILLLTASNFSFLLLLVVLVYCFIFQSTRSQKSVIVVCLSLLILFMAKISPQNNNYILNAYKKITGIQSPKPPSNSSNLLITERPDSTLSPEERKQKIAFLYLDSIQKNLPSKKVQTNLLPITAIAGDKKPSIPQASIHTEPFQRRRDTTQLQKDLLNFANQTMPNLDTSIYQTKKEKLPGKILAIKQTVAFFKQQPSKLLLGTGIGNFSSKLAFRVTGMQTVGGYPKKFSYINDNFRYNHLELYLNYFTRDIEVHSFINSPNNAYDQLVSEYGLLGLLSFVSFYFFWFAKRSRGTLSGIPILLLMLGAFTMDYWFEQLSVVILFELLMLLNLKEKEERNV